VAPVEIRRRPPVSANPTYRPLTVISGIDDTGRRTFSSGWHVIGLEDTYI